MKKITDKSVCVVVRAIGEATSAKKKKKSEECAVKTVGSGVKTN